jgi:hypothetical protein
MPDVEDSAGKKDENDVPLCRNGTRVRAESSLTLQVHLSINMQMHLHFTSKADSELPASTRMREYAATAKRIHDVLPQQLFEI